MGLPGAPKIKFLNKDAGKKKKNASRAVEALQAEIAKEKEAKKMDSDEDDLGSSDEEETHLDIDEDKPAHPKVSSFRFAQRSDILTNLLSSLPSVQNTTKCSSARTKSSNITTNCWTMTM